MTYSASGDMLGVLDEDVHEYFILDGELNQRYLEHWNEETIRRQDLKLQEYHSMILEIMEAARAQWPFLAE